MTTKAIAYYRVSTQKQGQSGLGLEAQQAAVVNYAAAANRLTIVSPAGEFTEIETGTNKRQRPKLQAAIAAAKAHDAVLLIAKLDRLARNVHFITGLQESGVKFVAVDMPEANELTVQIMAVMAQHEAKMISERTKAALGAAKARGVKLGSPDNLTDQAQQTGQIANKEQARRAYQKLSGYIQMMRDTGMSCLAIARKLNDEGNRTRTGKEFQAMTIKRILERG
ncbi:MAG: recombinase family protein [Chloroflexota bacterium]